MRRILFSIVAIIATLTTFAQADKSDILSATLLHGNQTKVFYTKSAIVDALKEAADGDTIIVSEGTFNDFSISKSISIYGAGQNKTFTDRFILSEQKGYDEYGKEYYYYPTVKIEGMHFTGQASYTMCNINESKNNAVLHNLEIRKCSFAYIRLYANTQNCIFSSCIFKYINGNSKASHQSLAFNNCHFEFYTPDLGDHTNNIIYDHCILNYSYNYCIATYTNCIIRGTVPAYSTAYNNIFINETVLGENVIGEGNWFGIATNGIYAAEGEDGSYADDKDFALKFPKLYVGTDGTEVGINGGHGFSRISATPSIVKSEIDTRAEEGKIKVNITVEAHSK